MVASKAAYASVHVPAAWPRVEFTSLGESAESALKFMEFATECRELTLAHESPSEILAFLEAVADLAVADSITTLVVRVVVVDALDNPPRVSSKIFRALAKFPNLETLHVHLGTAKARLKLKNISMPRLRTLRIIERHNTDDDEMFHIVRGVLRATVLFAESDFPALETLELTLASSSDVLNAVYSMPELRRLVYRSRDDTYEEGHADLGDRRLDSLTLTPAPVQPGGACLRVLLKYGIITARHVTLLVSSNLELDDLPGVEELTLVLVHGADVSVSWHVLKQLHAVNISGDGHGIFRVHHCRMLEFARFWKNNVHMDFHRDCILITDSSGLL